jgi:hypothetical protein
MFGARRIPRRAIPLSFAPLFFLMHVHTFEACDAFQRIFNEARLQLISASPERSLDDRLRAKTNLNYLLPIRSSVAHLMRYTTGDAPRRVRFLVFSLQLLHLCFCTAIRST